MPIEIIGNPQETGGQLNATLGSVTADFDGAVTGAAAFSGSINRALDGVQTSLVGAFEAAGDNIIRRYDYSTGDYTQWTFSDGVTPQFAGVPAYGRPVYPPDGATRYPGVSPSIFGNGELMGLVQNLGGRSGYANRCMIKNQTNTTEPDDCDAGNCTRRRTELNHHLIVGDDGQTLPYLSERWISISWYLPSDYDLVNGTSWMTFFQLKSPRTNQISPTISAAVTVDGSWGISHRWSDVDNPNSFTVIPSWYQMTYNGSYPNAGEWPDGLADFPEAGSQAALGVVTLGGWTDFVFHVRFDGRGAAEGGTGFLKAWKRDNDGPWNHVLNITPKETTRGGVTFDHGIGYKVPGSGFGPLTGMYADNERVLPIPNNRVLYNANLKIGNENATFAEMSPDGSVP